MATLDKLERCRLANEACQHLTGKAGFELRGGDTLFTFQGRGLLRGGGVRIGASRQVDQDRKDQPRRRRLGAMVSRQSALAGEKEIPGGDQEEHLRH